MTREQLIEELVYTRNVRFGELVAIVLGLAAETHPETIKKTLEGVFDLECVREESRRMMDELYKIHQGVLEARDELRQLKREIERAEAQLSILQARIER
jgi:hypothetical protein